MCAVNLGSFLPQDVVNAKHLCVFEDIGQLHRRRELLKITKCIETTSTPRNSCTLLKPGRVFREVKCYYVLTSYLRFRPEPDNCSLVCQHGVGGGIRIELVKTGTGTACVLGWFCAACDVLHAPLTC